MICIKKMVSLGVVLCLAAVLPLSGAGGKATVKKLLLDYTVLLENTNRALAKAADAEQAAAGLSALAKGSRSLDKQLKKLGEQQQVMVVFQRYISDPQLQRLMMRYSTAAQQFATLLQQVVAKYAMDSDFQDAMREYNSSQNK